MVFWIPLLQGKAERVGVLQLGEEKAPRRFFFWWHFLIYKGSYKKDGERIFTKAYSDRTRGNSSKLKEGRLGWA